MYDGTPPVEMTLSEDASLRILEANFDVIFSILQSISKFPNYPFHSLCSSITPQATPEGFERTYIALAPLVP